MIIENQICSLEQAKKLKELGVNFNSLYYYVLNWANPRGEDVNDGEMIIPEEQRLITKNIAKKRNAEVQFISAYTAGELIEMNGNVLNIKKEKGMWFHQTSLTYHPTFTQACAQKLIRQIQQKLVTLKEIEIRIK